MYNGIGLKTARGTGTNGYIQRNLSNVRPRDNPFTKPASSSAPDVRHTQPDAAILEHERKRRVEVRCMELRIQLEDDDVADDEIELQVQALREKLTAQLEQQREEEAVSKVDAARLRVGDTHRLAEAKQHDERRFARAVGVESGYREGDAFDRELQERKKQERIEERRRRDEERKREWERRKEQQAEARRERERPHEERDAGWTRHSAREEKVSRSPSPRASKRSKYSKSSGSESDSSERSLRRRGEGKDKRRELQVEVEVEVEVKVELRFSFALAIKVKVEITLCIAFAFAFALAFALSLVSIAQRRSSSLVLALTLSLRLLA